MISSFKIKWVISLLALPMVALAVLSSSAVTGAMPQGIDLTFKTKCATCHSVDGSGGTPMGKKMQVRDLRSAEVQKQTDAQLQTIISKGKGKMPGFEKSLGADQVKQLVAHVRELAKKK